MSDVRAHLAKGRPVFPPEHSPQTKARLRAEARLVHPEVYHFELDVPEDIWEHAPDLAEKIQEQRKQRRET